MPNKKNKKVINKTIGSPIVDKIKIQDKAVKKIISEK